MNDAIIGCDISRDDIGGGLVKVLANFFDLGLLLLAVVSVVIMFLIFLEARSDTITHGKGLLEKVVRKLHALPIAILQVGFQFLRFSVDGALLIAEDSNLDASSIGGAHGTGVVLIAVVILVIELFTSNELRGVYVAVLLSMFSMFWHSA